MSSGSFQSGVMAQVCALRGLEGRGEGAVRGMAVPHQRPPGFSIFMLKEKKKEKETHRCSFDVFFFFYLVFTSHVWVIKFLGLSSVRTSVSRRRRRD